MTPIPENTAAISLEAQQVINRYKHGYRVAGTLDGVGSFAQLIAAAVILGGVAFAFLLLSGVATWLTGGVAVILGVVLCLGGDGCVCLGSRNQSAARRCGAFISFSQRRPASNRHVFIVSSLTAA
jgi:hypothetical protein